jgi:site-specific DNA-methyltransferase (adenine-specific)
MNDQASFTLRGRNPDVLTCIANLSNDEVFTPPEFANRMLDTLAEAWAANNGGADLWADSSVRFLDPFTKSGVFLREITSRLTKGLAPRFPTSKSASIISSPSRCSASASPISPACWRGAACIARSMPTASTPLPRLFQRRRQHLVRAHGAHMGGGRCKFCGASQKTLDRGEDLRPTPMRSFTPTTSRLG